MRHATLSARQRFLTKENVLRLLLAVILISAIHTLTHSRTPWKSAWGRHMAAGKDPTLREQVEASAWFAAAARAGISALLLALSFTWVRDKPERTDQASRNDLLVDEAMQGPSRAVFTGTIAVILAAALVLRLPRMTHSFWGDEADAVATYAHGHLIPEKKDDPQGPLKFDPVSWPQRLYGAERGPNNHVVFSLLSLGSLELWQRIGGHGESEFTEWVCRLPVLIAGLASLVLLPWLLARWGSPWTGLLASAFMSLHPWHVRYTTEARGYGIMICLFIALMHVLTSALQRNRWRDWLLFSLCEFITMWTWAGAAYPFALLNLAIVIHVIIRTRAEESRLVSAWRTLSRWLTANMLAAAAFISVYLPIVLQVARLRDNPLRNGWMKGREMNAAWLHNLLTEPITGIPFHAEDAANVSEVSWQRLLSASPIITGAGFALLIGLIISGIVVLWRRSKPVALLLTAIFGAMPLSAVHFYFGLKNELLVWYWFFALPWLSVAAAVGAVQLAKFVSQDRSVSVAISMALLAIVSISLWPMTREFIRQPTEDYRGVTISIRGGISDRPESDHSKIFTVWLWRFSPLYDPRGDTHVRDAKALRERMNLAKSGEGELFVVVGYRSLAESLNHDMLAILDDPAVFEKRATFRAQEALHTLTVYRMK